MDLDELTARFNLAFEEKLLEVASGEFVAPRATLLHGFFVEDINGAGTMQVRVVHHEPGALIDRHIYGASVFAVRGQLTIFAAPCPLEPGDRVLLLFTDTRHAPRMAVMITEV